MKNETFRNLVAATEYTLPATEKYPNEDRILKTTNELLNKKLVASCQVVESNSKWHWKNEIEGAKEYLLFMKSKKSLSKEIFEVIKSIHSYDCFEFAIFSLESCNEDYLKWIDEETK